MNNDSTHDRQPSSSLTPWHWGWSAFMATIVLVTLAFRYALPVRDGDLWWHMLYGKYFLENMTLIADHTIFSWTPTTNDTIYVTWLPDIFLYLLHKAAGLPGIFAFRYLCMLVPVLGCFLYARKLKIATHPLTWLLCLLAVIMSYTAAFEKPEILSFVFMTLLAWNWWHIRSSGEKAWKNCYLFPAIMLVWVNTHGGFVFGAIFLALIGLGEILNTWLSPQNVLSPRLRKHLVIALLLTAITPLLNPYGYRYPLQLFFDLLPTDANTNYNKKIAAYDSPFAFSDTYLLTVGADTMIVLLFLLYLRNFKKIEWSSLLTNLIFSFLYTRFFRSTFYWVPVFLFSGLHLLSLAPVVPPGWKYAKPTSRLLPGLMTIVALLLAGTASFNSYFRAEKYLWMGFGISDANPVTETEYIEKYFPDARIGNTYDQGAYLLWKLWTKNKIFFDSRHFPFRNWSDKFFDFSAGRNITPMIRDYPCDLWCISIGGNNRLLMWFIRSKDWRLVFYGKNSAVLLRRNIPIPEGSPRVSADIAALRSLSNAVDVLRFACAIKDWDTAQIVLSSMQKKFSLPPHRAAILWATHLHKGTHAYYKGKYHQAAKAFEGMADPPEVIRFMLTNCYHYLSGIAWQQGDEATARSYARKAWNLIPDNPYSLFNLAVIVWQQEHDSATAIENLPDWRIFLQKFLRVAPQEKDFESSRILAATMLDGHQKTRPSLLIPPEPTSLQLKTSDISWRN